MMTTTMKVKATTVRMATTVMMVVTSLKRKTRVETRVATTKTRRRKASLMRANQLQTPVTACPTSRQMSIFRNPM